MPGRVPGRRLSGEIPMKYLRVVMLVVAPLAGSACASHSGNLRHDVSQEPAAHEAAGGSGALPAVEADAVPASGPVMASSLPRDATQIVQEAAGGADDVIADHRDDAESDEPAPASVGLSGLREAEEDAAMLYGDSAVRDPWEGYNRRVHGFNNAVDRRFLRPLAAGYAKAVPAPVRAGVSRFFRNLGEPATAINQALQGNPLLSLASLGRFAVNTTLGVAGVFDPASRMGLRDRGSEDFGQTLAVWGWRDSRYLVIPFLGPRTVRDTVSLIGDRKTAPFGYIDDSRTAAALQLLDIVDGRTGLMSFDGMRRDAYDDYVFVRDAWSQRRKHQMERDDGIE